MKLVCRKFSSSGVIALLYTHGTRCHESLILCNNVNETSIPKKQWADIWGLEEFLYLAYTYVQIRIHAYTYVQMWMRSNERHGALSWVLTKL